MSKLIRMTDEQIEDVLKEIRESIKGDYIYDGKLSFTKQFDAPESKATVYFTKEAWIKMTMLVQMFDKELAWNGVACRKEGEENAYVISDIMVYPQEVTGATVSMDETEYAKWLQENDDERFYQIHFQGHSHVRMSTGPSSTDHDHQRKIVEQLKKNGFYLFAIYNKSYECNWRIFDMQKNILFENGDVTVKIEDIDDFISDAKAKVRERSYTPTTTYSPPSYTTYNYRGTYGVPIGVTPVGQTTKGPYDPLKSAEQRRLAATASNSKPKTTVDGADISGQTTIQFPEPKASSDGKDWPEYTDQPYGNS